MSDWQQQGKSPYITEDAMRNIAIREGEWKRQALFWVAAAYAVHNRLCETCMTEKEKSDHILRIKENRDYDE